MNLSIEFGGAAGKSISNRPLDVIVSTLNEPPRLVSEIKLILDVTALKWLKKSS